MHVKVYAIMQLLAAFYLIKRFYPITASINSTKQQCIHLKKTLMVTWATFCQAESAAVHNFSSVCTDDTTGVSGATYVR